MNYCKEKLVSGLTSLIDELQCDDACREHISLLVEAREYIRELPVIYDKETVIKLIACYRCQKCSEDFDMNKKRCAERYMDASIMFEQNILDEHDEFIMNEPGGENGTGN